MHSLAQEQPLCLFQNTNLEHSPVVAIFKSAVKIQQASNYTKFLRRGKSTYGSLCTVE